MPILAGQWRAGGGRGKGVSLPQSQRPGLKSTGLLLSAGVQTHDVMLCILFVSSSPSKPLFFFAHH